MVTIAALAMCVKTFARFINYFALLNSSFTCLLPDIARTPDCFPGYADTDPSCNDRSKRKNDKPRMPDIFLYAGYSHEVVGACNRYDNAGKKSEQLRHKIKRKIVEQ